MCDQGAEMYYFIEPMSVEDIEHVQHIDRESFPNPWSATTYQRELGDSAHNRYIVVRATPTPPPPSQAAPLAHAAYHPSALLRQVFGLLYTSIHKQNGTSPHPHIPTPIKEPIVGHGGFVTVLDEAHITLVAVAPAYRGLGIGELLLNGLIDLAFAMNMTTMTLEVRRSNVVAQNLYQKYGFALVGERRHYYTDNREDALIMTSEPLQDSQFQARLRQHRWHLFSRLGAASTAPDIDSSDDTPPQQTVGFTASISS